jgi:hypothetical protein
MTDQVDTVPTTLSRYTSAAQALRNEAATTPPTITSATTQWVPSDRHGRIPVIGLDSGHLPGSRPDTLERYA